MQRHLKTAVLSHQQLKVLQKLTKHNVQVKKLQRHVQTQKHIKNICFVKPTTECFLNIITLVLMIMIRAYDNYVAAHGARDDVHNHYHFHHHHVPSSKVFGPVDKPSGQIKSTLGRAELKSSL